MSDSQEIVGDEERLCLLRQLGLRKLREILRLRSCVMRRLLRAEKIPRDCVAAAGGGHAAGARRTLHRCYHREPTPGRWWRESLPQCQTLAQRNRRTHAVRTYRPLHVQGSAPLVHRYVHKTRSEVARPCCRTTPPTPCVTPCGVTQITWPGLPSPGDGCGDTVRPTLLPMPHAVTRGHGRAAP